MGSKKLQVWLPLLFSVVLIAGMFFGYKLNKGGSSKGFFKTSRPTSLQEALDLIRTKYVDPVNLDSLQGGAIQEMMSELDPHSVYFPPVEAKESVEDLAGNFDGIGVEFNVFEDTVNIVYVMPNGPSETAGLKLGDKIVAVNDSSLVGVNASSARIREFIRGKSGSTAAIRIVRDGKTMVINVKRGSIPVPSVDAAYMIDKTTGYIKLNKFTATSYEEFMAALEDLNGKGMKELIYDLRGNNGGFMNEAIDMADEFLDGDKLIVYTEGLHNKKREYRCKRPGLFEKGKLIVLIDELSASATEVLVGALQDWDRATIVGRRSFGKGLVLEQYDLSDGSSIRLTVARYYTPLGRSIQRPYDKGKKVYMDEIWERYSNGEALFADSNKINKGKEFRTPAGHIVFGGGGIMPDVFVPIDTSTYPSSINRLFINGTSNSFVYMYYLKNRQQIDNYASATDYAQHFNQTQQMWNEFTQYAAMKDSVNPGTLNVKQQETLQRRLEALLGRFRWRSNGYIQVLNHDDTAVNKAIELSKK